MFLFLWALSNFHTNATAQSHHTLFLRLHRRTNASLLIHGKMSLCGYSPLPRSDRKTRPRSKPPAPPKDLAPPIEDVAAWGFNRTWERRGWPIRELVETRPVETAPMQSGSGWCSPMMVGSAAQASGPTTASRRRRSSSAAMSKSMTGTSRQEAPPALGAPPSALTLNLENR